MYDLLTYLLHLIQTSVDNMDEKTVNQTKEDVIGGRQTQTHRQTFTQTDRIISD